MTATDVSGKRKAVQPYCTTDEDIYYTIWSKNKLIICI